VRIEGDHTGTQGLRFLLGKAIYSFFLIKLFLNLEFPSDVLKMSSSVIS
jgi:hypothetical protein